MLMNFPAIGARRSLMADTRGVLLFGVCYVALDWASSIYPLSAFNITPWNPPPALSIVWMLLGGLRFAPVVFAALFAGDLLIRDAPGGLQLSIMTSLVLATGYTGIAAVLRLRFKFEGRLHETRQLWNFIAVTAVGAAIISFAYVGILWISGSRIGDSFFDAAFRFWLGDTVGVLVTAPLLMVAADPERRQQLIQSWRKPETALQFVTLIGLIFIVFRGGETPHQYFYILFLPLIWIAVRNGLSGAVAASGVVQIGVVLGAQIGSLQVLAVLQMQMLVTALTLTGLALGIIVDERQQALVDLKRSLRLAVASEMAGAIAHEINQPLAAMHNYGSACQIILRQSKDASASAELSRTVDKMLQESKRAAEVVRRLRDLFRRGAIRLEPVTVDMLLERANAIGQQLCLSQDVTFDVDSKDGAQMLKVDRIQIELVLRNLIANAFEAVAELPSGKKGVKVSTLMLKGNRILFRVTDTGKGMTASARQRAFEPHFTSKARGLGIGLSISRTIADAHGGSLTVGEGLPSEFDLVLPIKGDHEWRYG